MTTFALVAFGIAIGIPIGVAIARLRAWGRWLLEIEQSKQGAVR